MAACEAVEKEEEVRRRGSLVVLALVTDVASQSRKSG